MAKKVKITKGGQTVYPATVMDAVVHPDLRVDASKLIEEVNVSKIYPTGGIDGTNKYTLETAIAMIPTSLRNVGIKCSFLDEAGQFETWEYIGGASANANNWKQTGTKAFTELGKIIQPIFGTLFDKEATGTDLADVTSFILDMKYAGTSLDKEDNYSLFECRKNDDGTRLQIFIKNDSNSNAYWNNEYLLSDVPSDYTRGFDRKKLGDFYFVFNWNCFKDFLYTKGAYPLRKLNNSFIFGLNIQEQLAKVDTNETRLDVLDDSVVHIQDTYVNKEDAIIEGVNLYNISKNEEQFIIKEGDSYNKVSSRYYSITGFLPYNSNSEWIYSGCSTGYFTDLGCIAFFKEESEDTYLGAIRVPATSRPEYGLLTGQFTEANYVKFTLRRIGFEYGIIDLEEFSYAKKDMSGRIANIESQTEQNTSDIALLKTTSYDLTDVVIDAMGDSYTQMGYDDNRGFMFFGAKLLGIEKSQINNYGIGGTKIAKTSSADNDSSVMVNRYQNMEDCDIYTLLGGYNDSNAPFNNWNDKLGSVETKDDPTTIFGACCTIIEGYRGLYPYSNAIPVIMTYPYAPDSNKKALNQCLRDVADYYNAPLIDFEKTCGFIDGKNCRTGRPNILDGYMDNWISGQRPHYNGSDTMLTDPDWGYIPDYIPRPVGARVLWVPINCNLHQYKQDNGEYVWLKQTGTREAELLDECTHIRFAYYESNKDSAYIRVEDGTFVCDGDIHPNLLGFKLRMAPVWAAKMKDLLFPKTSL